MKWLTLQGRVKDIPTARYIFDWNGSQGSKFAKSVLEWLRPYIKNDIILAEYQVAGTRMRYDYVNVSRKVIYECDGKQHDLYSKHFHGSRSVFGAQLKRDILKDRIAVHNGFKVIRIKVTDLPLTKEWFKKTYDYDL